VAASSPGCAFPSTHSRRDQHPVMILAAAPGLAAVDVERR
jgi:hypothetical protein